MEKQNELFGILDTLRAHGSLTNPATYLKAIAAARANGIAISYDDIAPLLQSPHLEIWHIPSPAISFLLDLLGRVNAKSLLDPFAGYGGIVLPCVERKRNLTVSALCQTEEQVAFIQSLNNSPEQMLKVIPTDTLEYEPANTYDVICSFPVIGGANEERSHGTATGVKKIRGTLSRHTMLAASRFLNKEGRAIFIVPRSFGKGNDSDIWSVLADFGLYLDSVIEWGELTLNRLSIPLEFVVFGRQPVSKVFVAQFASDKAVNETIIENWIKRKAGESPELGRLVDSSSPTSISQITTTENMEKLAREWGCTTVTLDAAAKRIFRMPPKEEENSGANRLFIPLIGHSNVVISQDEFTLKPQNYVGVDLDEERATNQFIAQFLNTELGRNSRETLKSGTFIPKLTNQGVGKIRMVLPSRDQQLEMIRIQSLISNKRAELKLLEHSLWQNPEAIPGIAEQLADPAESQSFENWLETLPFPIASVLWTYHVAADDSKRVQHLLHVFEALAEFLAIFLLSGFAQDEAVYKQHCDQWIDRKDPKFHKRFEKSSFGSWSLLASKLASVVRKTLNAQDDSNEKLKSLFGNPSQSFFEVILQKDIFTLLNTVSAKRNDWLGHTGFVSDAEYYRRRVLLEADLAKLRQLISNHLNKAHFLLPLTSRFSKGTYHYNAKLLRGSRAAFRSIEVQTRMPMEENQIHFVYEGQHIPLPMLPLIRMYASPSNEQTACYFFNRCTDDGEQKFVSYHFSTESELITPDEHVNAALGMLKADFGLDT